MRYLNMAVVLAGVSTSAIYGCGDGDSVGSHGATGGTAGEAGAVETGGSSSGGKSGAGGTSAHAGSAGKGGSAGQLGSAGEGGMAGEGGTEPTGGTGGSAAGTGGSNGGTVGVAGTAGLGGTGGGTAGTGGLGGTGGATAGSGGGGGTGGSVETPGSLAVTVSGVPSGQTATITISGPGNSSQTISATQTLAGLAAGDYTVSGSPVRVPGARVDTVFDATITGLPVHVGGGTTSNVSVTYAQRPGTGKLWVANWSSRAVFGFDSTQIATAGTVSAAASSVLVVPNLGTASPASPSIAFAPDGAAWIGYCKGGAVPEYVTRIPPSQLDAQGAVSSDVTITLPSGTAQSPDLTYECVGGLTFDSAGNLWVATNTDGVKSDHVLRFDAADLKVSGTPTPAVTLTSTSFSEITDIAFDAAGNLFAGSYGKPLVARVSATQLTTSNDALVPDVLLSMPAGSGVGGLTFDQSGALWVTDYNGNRAIQFAATDIGATGAPTPGVIITGISGAEQLAFDQLGNLWVNAFNANKVLSFAAADLTTSGAKAAVTTLTANAAFKSPYGLRFNPGAR